MDNYFAFNGTSSLDMGLHVEKRVKKRIPEKQVKTYSIAGRSRDLHIWDGAYENYKIAYECFFEPAAGKSLADQAHDIAEWLHNAPFEARLEDSYDADVYRLASYIGGEEIEDIMGAVGRVKISFDVAAPAYLKSGETALNITGAGLVNNPTPFVSLPLIEIDVNGKLGGVIRIADYSVNLSVGGIPATTVYIDCDIREAWYFLDGVEISCNQVVKSPNWPQINPGTSTIEISGIGVDAARVYTRVYTL